MTTFKWHVSAYLHWLIFQLQLYSVDQKPILRVYYDNVGGDPVMKFHIRPYVWILMKIRNFQCYCSDLDLWPSTKWLDPCLLMRFEPVWKCFPIATLPAERVQDRLICYVLLVNRDYVIFIWTRLVGKVTIWNHFHIGSKWIMNQIGPRWKRYWEDSKLTERWKASVAAGRLFRPQDEYKMTV